MAIENQSGANANPSHTEAGHQLSNIQQIE